MIASTGLLSKLSRSKRPSGHIFEWLSRWHGAKHLGLPTGYPYFFKLGDIPQKYGNYDPLFCMALDILLGISPIFQNPCHWISLSISRAWCGIQAAFDPIRPRGQRLRCPTMQSVNISSKSGSDYTLIILIILSKYNQYNLSGIRIIL